MRLPVRRFPISAAIGALLFVNWVQHAEAAFEELLIDSAGETYDRNTEDGINFVATNLNVGSSGSGLISPFLSTTGFGSTTKQGYTSDRASGEFDEKENFTRSLLTTEPSTFSNYTEFLLDVAEPNTNQFKFITIDQIQIFAATFDYATDPNLTSTGFAADTPGGAPVITFDPAYTEEIFRLADYNVEYAITIDASLGAGGGQYDLRLFIDFDAFDAAYTNYIFYVHYTNQHPLGEEWSIARDDLAAIPEPSTWALLLITACAALCVQCRHQRKLKAEAEPTAG